MAFTKKVASAADKPKTKASSSREESGHTAGESDANNASFPSVVNGIVEWEQSPAIDKIAKAFVAFRKVAKNPEKDKQGYNYRYTTLDNIINTLREPLNKCGLAVTQHPVSDQCGGVGIVTMLIHESGQYWRARYILPTPLMSGQINATQEAGAAITYARRYGINAILGTTSDEDTDAASAEVGASLRKKK